MEKTKCEIKTEPNPLLARMFGSGYDHECKTHQQSWKSSNPKPRECPKSRECPATLEVDFGKNLGDEKRGKATLTCCRFKGHANKHSNPRLQLTVGGKIAEEAGDEWTPYTE